MLSMKSAVTTVRVTNLEQAKQFYGGVLGLKPDSSLQAPGHYGYDCGSGSRLAIYEGGASKAEHTLASFEVSDLDGAVKDLKAKGVKFENYDFPGLKTVEGIASIGNWRGGWFKDPDGNIFAVGQLG
ncbi:MAG TPA: VOC family protein [Chloroflexota bacterium]|jgi:catechol 2,3-dioxygenase-like lactoylglutathione lyase family enzyme